MRSLTSKLVFAFLAVSLISIGVIVLLSHFATNREFNRFISNQYQSEISEELSTYYQENGSWEGVNQISIRPTSPPIAVPNENRPNFFAVTDANGQVILESFQHKKGDVIDSEHLESAVPNR